LYYRNSSCFHLFNFLEMDFNYFDLNYYSLKILGYFFFGKNESLFKIVLLPLKPIKKNWFMKKISNSNKNKEIKQIVKEINQVDSKSLWKIKVKLLTQSKESRDLFYSFFFAFEKKKKKNMADFKAEKKKIVVDICIADCFCNRSPIPDRDILLYIPPHHSLFFEVRHVVVSSLCCAQWASKWCKFFSFLFFFFFFLYFDWFHSFYVMHITVPFFLFLFFLLFLILFYFFFFEIYYFIPFFI